MYVQQTQLYKIWWALMRYEVLIWANMVYKIGDKNMQISKLSWIVASGMGRIVASSIGRIVASGMGRKVASGMERIVASGMGRIVASDMESISSVSGFFTHWLIKWKGYICESQRSAAVHVILHIHLFQFRVNGWFVYYVSDCWKEHIHDTM